MRPGNCFCRTAIRSMVCRSGNSAINSLFDGGCLPVAQWHEDVFVSFRMSVDRMVWVQAMCKWREGRCLPVLWRKKAFSCIGQTRGMGESPAKWTGLWICSGDGDGIGVFLCLFLCVPEQDVHTDGQNDEADAVAEPESGCAGDSVGNPGGAEAEGQCIAAAQSDAPQCQET